MDNAAELSALMRSRAEMYAFLSRCFRTEVDDELLATLEGLESAPKTGNAEVDEGYRLIFEYLRAAREHGGEVSEGRSVRTDLAVDFTRAFISRGRDGHAVAYPFESVYTSAKRLLMQKARTEAVEAYRAAGFKAANWHEPEDHIAVELEFMEMLSLRCADALDAADEDAASDALSRQVEFCALHLANWVPEFAADMERFAKTGFYLGLAHLLRGFIAEDCALLSDLC